MSETMKKPGNLAQFSFSAQKENVVAARLLAASFASQIGFTLSEIEEIKVAVSEGVSNAIIHGYGQDAGATVYMSFEVTPEYLSIVIEDKGRGIEDVARAMEPTFTTVSERMGLGFVFMQSFMDEFKVDTAVGKGTVLHMKKYAGSHEQ